VVLWKFKEPQHWLELVLWGYLVCSVKSGAQVSLLLEWASILFLEIAQELNDGINLFLNPETEVEIIKSQVL